MDYGIRGGLMGITLCRLLNVMSSMGFLLLAGLVSSFSRISTPLAQLRLGLGGMGPGWEQDIKHLV